MRKNYTLSFLMLAMMLVSVLVQGQAPDLLARYTFDETEGTVAADASGNGYDATVDCDTCWTEGTIGGALAFNGTGIVTLPAGDMGLTSNFGSVAFWMKLSTAGADMTGINTIFWGGDEESGSGFGPENEMSIHVEKPEDVWTGGEIGMWIQGEGDASFHVFSDPDKGTSAGVAPVNPILVNDGEWHHIACTWGDGTCVLYIDGATVMSKEYTPLSFDLNYMILGRMLTDEGRAYTGLLDDFRMYDAVLIDLDVEDLYNKDFSGVDQLLRDDATLSVYPNPAAGNATIRFRAEAGQDVSVMLYSLTGGLVANLYEGVSLDGVNDVLLNADDYAPGLYMVKLQAGNQVSYTKFILQ